MVWISVRRVVAFAVFTIFACGPSASPAAASETAEHAGVLAAYVARPDPSFAWREVSSGRVGSAEYVEYLMTSQTWRDIPWKHQLFILRPANMTKEVREGLLFIHGGRWKPEYEAPRKQAALPGEALLFARLATTIGAPVAVLRQVPFAPLFERREDALIAYTFDQYLQSGESDWPLLLPMVKSSVRAMDLMQTVVQQRWGAALERFTVAGASKRGWTSWLTAAVDARVMAVAPIVIDVLNMQAQMAHQRATWGEVSDEIRDYSAIDLPTRLATERGRELLSIVDPYSYRERLTQSKLILLSTNDRYWPLDALKLYWSDLPEPKHVLYVPNQGHDLRDIDRVIGALSAVHRHAAESKPLPRVSWSFTSQRDSLSIRVKADAPMKRVLVWTAHSDTRDFRDAHWRSRECPRNDDAYACSTGRGERGYTAAFAEAAFEADRETSFSVSSTVCVAPAAAIEPSPGC
jgi:PhoPQ-activated pathogenicity-related protein